IGGRRADRCPGRSRVPNAARADLLRHPHHLREPARHRHSRAADGPGVAAGRTEDDFMAGASMMTEPLIQISGVTKVFDHGGQSDYAVKDVDLRIGEGEFVQVVVPAGWWKS